MEKIFLLILPIIALILLACNNPLEEIGVAPESALPPVLTEDSIEFKTEDGVEIAMDSTNETEWPEDISTDVPQFDGNIISVMKGEDSEFASYTVEYENLIITEMASYENMLNDYGWEIITTGIHEDGWTINAGKENLMLLALIHNDNEGVIQISIED